MASESSRIELVPVANDTVSPSKRRHFVRLRGRNGRVLFVSPVTYTTLTQASRAADAIVEAMKQVLHTEAQGVTWPPQQPTILITDPVEKDPQHDPTSPSFRAGYDAGYSDADCGG